MFIKLTLEHNKDYVYINTNLIQSFTQNKTLKGRFTSIYYNDDDSYSVTETPEEILNLIKGNYLNV